MFSPWLILNNDGDVFLPFKPSHNPQEWGIVDFQRDNEDDDDDEGDFNHVLPFDHGHAPWDDDGDDDDDHGDFNHGLPFNHGHASWEGNTP